MSWDNAWENIYKKRDWGMYPNENLVRYLKSNQKLKGKKILEVGCGIGANIWFCSEQGLKTYGIDGSSTAIKKAKKILKSRKAKANLKVGDIINLPYRSNYFDFVVDIECVYSNTEKNSKNIINEIRRVLKPGGIFYSLSFGKKSSHINYTKNILGEKSTFLNTGKNVFKKDYKIIRFMDIKDVKRIYKSLKLVSIDEVTRSLNNRKRIVHEWIIISKK